MSPPGVLPEQSDMLATPQVASATPCIRGSPLGHLKPPQSWKNHVTAKIVRVAANILHVLAYISRVVADKAVEEAKSCWPMKFFFHFWGFFSKSVQKIV